VKKEMLFPTRLPIIPLVENVALPYVLTPIVVLKDISTSALELAEKTQGYFLFLTIVDVNKGAQPKNLNTIGVLGRLYSKIALPDGTYRLLVDGIIRVKVSNIRLKNTVYYGSYLMLPEGEKNSRKIQALTRSVIENFVKYVNLSSQVSDEVITQMKKFESPLVLGYFVLSNLKVDVRTKQKVLEMNNIEERYRFILNILYSEIDILKIEKKIDSEVHSQMEKHQKKIYLYEQLKAIKKELGMGEDEGDELDEIYKKIDEKELPEEVKKIAIKEWKRLRRMMPISPEGTVVRNYLDWILSLPWKERTEDNLDIENAKNILDKAHYGLKKIKERITEYLAVLKVAGSIKGQVLCFVGPPGTGKTSVARSIADAIRRKFIRVSLGGIRDEAEIRGHRRTYIGALPGKIIQKIRRAGVKNPVFLLDEVDKIGQDYRGDPAAALLEALDPEVNEKFNDHYLEIDFDLSDVLFITTANTTNTIPSALLDRMEVLKFPGYLEYEKVRIGKDYLWPKVLKMNGLPQSTVSISDNAISFIIKNYTKEAGVRQMERAFSSIARKIVKQTALKGNKNHRITEGKIEKFLGAPAYTGDEVVKDRRVGIATGLAVTPAGGEVISIEVSIMRGTGQLILTGQLGDVMKESAQASLSYIRSHCKEFGLKENFYKNIDIHIHIPEGAVPKDGPSAGITLSVAILSALKKIPTKGEIGMTGEITLRGALLPVGGLAEKIVAAKRVGLKRVIIPEKNKKEFLELPRQAKSGIEIIYASSIKDVFLQTFTYPIFNQSSQ